MAGVQFTGINNFFSVALEPRSIWGSITGIGDFPLTTADWRLKMRPMNLGRAWSIAEMREFTDEELYLTMNECASPGYYQFAVEELLRRNLVRLGEATVRLGDIATKNTRATETLANSSSRVESLTSALKWLTVVLAVLAAVQIGVSAVPLFR